MHRSIFHVGLLALCASCASAPVFVRGDEEGDHGRVEVAWVELAPPAGRPPVLLLNMVHLGEPRYYAEVQARLDLAPLVLMEGIVRTRASSPPQRRIGADLYDLAEAFRLVHQVDVLEWRSHFRKADMGEAEFRALRGARTGSGPSLRDLQRDASLEVFRFRRRHPDVDAETAEDSVRRGAARRILARQITGDRDGRPGVVHARNRIALRALDECEVAGEVVMCWGFAHAEDLLRGLARRGYRVVAVTWHEVFRY